MQLGKIPPALFAPSSWFLSSQIRKAWLLNTRMLAWMQMKHLPRENMRTIGTKKAFFLNWHFLRWERFLSLLASVLSVLCKALPIKERKSRVLHETLDFTLHSGSPSLGIYSCSSWHAPGTKVWGKIFQSAIRWWVYNCTVNLRADKSCHSLLLFCL